MEQATPFGYLLVHFVEDPRGHGEQIFFSLSDGDDPQRWTRINRGRPVLESRIGTSGVRDPYLVRGGSTAFIIATDLRIYGGDDPDWDAFTRHGSRSLVVWQSSDLVHWSEPWLAEVAPPEAGMAWAPEAMYDEEKGTFLVYWSSTLFAEDDPEHAKPSHSRILMAKTTDFHTFTPAEILIDRGSDVIDLTIVKSDNRYFRFAKNNREGDDSLRVFQEVGDTIDATDTALIARSIGSDISEALEAPLVFRDNSGSGWHLWLDRYDDTQGYVALRSRDIASGDWSPVLADDFQLESNTKHGVVVPLLSDEWERLASAFFKP